MIGAVCPSDFTYLPAVNGCYKLVLYDLAWYDAGLRCPALHPKAHLVVIDNGNEQAAITQWLKSYEGKGTITTTTATSGDWYIVTKLV